MVTSNFLSDKTHLPTPEITAAAQNRVCGVAALLHARVRPTVKIPPQ